MNFADGSITPQFSGWSVFLKDSWDSASFVTNYLPLMLFPVLYIGASIWKKTPLIKPEDMDFITGIAEIEAECYDEPPPKNWIEKVWLWLVSVPSRPTQIEKLIAS